MEKQKFCSAVIVAAGQGKRMGTKISKQFLKLGEVEVIIHTLKKFQNCDDIDEIILVTGQEEISNLQQLAEAYKITKAARIVAGGKERQDSVWNGVQAVQAKADVVLVHDGVRPFVTQEDITRTIQTAREMGACVLGVKAKDTVKQCDAAGNIVMTPDRSLLWYIQTPQAFQKEILLQAFQQAREEGFLGTDDAMLVERLGKTVRVIEGSYKNIKITTKEDLAIAEVFLQQGC